MKNTERDTNTHKFYKALSPYGYMKRGLLRYTSNNKKTLKGVIS